jgi:hypothetical protein
MVEEACGTIMAGLADPFLTIMNTLWPVFFSSQ